MTLQTNSQNTPSSQQQIQPPSVMLLGAVGSGKSYSISTLAKAGLDVFVIITEPTGLDSILDAWQKEHLPLEKLHWKCIVPSRMGFEGLSKMVDLVSVANFKTLSEQPPTNNRKEAQFKEILKTLQNFTCERDGKSYGPVTSFDSSKALVIDSLSGINLMAMDLVIGDKVSAHVGEWGIAIKLIENLILNLCSNLQCVFAITAHMEKETNELTGAQQIMVSTLGRKLAPILPRFFSEVVMASGDDGKFQWATTAHNTALKSRALPISSKLDPSFIPIVEAYNRRLRFAQTQQAKEERIAEAVKPIVEKYQNQ